MAQRDASTTATELEIPDVSMSDPPVEGFLELSDDEKDTGLDPDELDGLARSVLKECKEASQLPSLETALLLLHEALDLRPVTHPNRITLLNNFALSLVVKYIWTDQASALDEALQLFEELSNLMSPGTMADNGIASNEGLGGYSRYAAHASEGELSAMINLALATMIEFCQAASISSIDSAIFLFRQAVDLRGPSDIKRSASMSGLANALISRSFHTRHFRDLDNAVSTIQECLQTQAASHLDQSPLLERLSAALVTRFILGGQSDDLTEAIRVRAQQQETHSKGSEAPDLSAQGSPIFEKFGVPGLHMVGRYRQQL